MSAVERDSPAEKAGLEPGDVIVGLNDKPINHSADLPGLVADLKPGTSTKLEIIRKGAAKTVSVAVGEMKTEQIARNGEGAAMMKPEVANMSEDNQIDIAAYLASWDRFLSTSLLADPKRWRPFRAAKPGS